MFNNDIFLPYMLLAQGNEFKPQRPKSLSQRQIEELVAEYKLIKDKKSELSSTKRKWVVSKVEKLITDGKINLNPPTVWKHPELREGEIFLINTREGEEFFSEGLPKEIESTRLGNIAYLTGMGSRLIADNLRPLFATLKPI